MTLIIVTSPLGDRLHSFCYSIEWIHFRAVDSVSNTCCVVPAERMISTEPVNITSDEPLGIA